MTMRSVERAVALLAGLHQIRTRRRPAWSASRARDHRRTAAFGWMTAIRGIGVGVKRVGGRATRDVSLRFYVARKRARADLPRDARIPERLWLDAIGAEVLTDVSVMRGRPRAHAPARVRPGCQVAHAEGDPGTLGLIVRYRAAPARFALSCSHVLGLAGLAAIGSDVVSPWSAAGEDDQFGRLVYRTELSTVGTFREDAALASIDVPSLTSVTPGGIQPDAVYDAVGGFSRAIETTLCGYETPLADGRVLDHAWSGCLHVNGVGPVHFSGLVPYRTEAAEGDSGAVVLRRSTSEALGLHLGGTRASGLQTGFFLPLSPLLDRLGLTLS